jgi:hypothetical protein
MTIRAEIVLFLCSVGAAVCMYAQLLWKLSGFITQMREQMNQFKTFSERTREEIEVLEAQLENVQRFLYKTSGFEIRR